MKRILITLIAGLSALAAFAQEKGEDMEQRFFDAKVREFVYALNITDAQKPDFVAVYKLYNDEMRATVGKKEKPEKMPETSEEAAAAVKTRLENQNKAQQVRIKYVDEFAKVLEPGQLLRFYDVEAQIQHKLMDRQNGPKGNGKGHGGRGNHGGRGGFGGFGGPGAPGTPGAPGAPGQFGPRPDSASED